MVEKPKLEDAPSNLIISGRYILQPQVFDRIAANIPAPAARFRRDDPAMAEDRFFGLKFDGKTYDCGDRVEFLAANVAYGLARDDLGPAFRQALKEIIADFGGL